MNKQYRFEILVHTFFAPIRESFDTLSEAVNYCLKQNRPNLIDCIQIIEREVSNDC